MTSITLNPSCGAVPDPDGYRDTVAFVEVSIPDELISGLRNQVTATFDAGGSPGEKADVAYGTACPEMVEHCASEIAGKTCTSPLTQLLELVRDAMTKLFPAVSSDSFSPPQIAYRWKGDEMNYGPHCDGLYDGRETLQPNVPFAVVGVYLDDVNSEKDAALMCWPARAAEVRKAISENDGTQLANNLCDIAGQCKTNDSSPYVVRGRAGCVFLVGGNVPHCNHERATDGERVAVYFRMYAAT
ncbi:hypothetical protein [Pandoraea apista]|uniref:hypothetical protein n=1 Tax=Pandoraea apista TaxID=93218 RepID=UPI00248DB6FC|nr:hypothetical protein [Pandoraea apista]